MNIYLLWAIGLVGACVVLTIAMNLPRELRLRRLASSRAGTDAFSAFRQALPEVPEDIVSLVYRGVQNLVPGADFPVRADDDLFETLEVDQGSYEDLIERLAERANAPFGGPLNTAGDLARAVWANRQNGDDGIHV